MWQFTYQIWPLWNKNLLFYLYFLEEKFEDTKGVIRRHASMNRQYNGQKKKDKSKMDRQYNGQKKKDKRSNNDPQNIT